MENVIIEEKRVCRKKVLWIKDKRLEEAYSVDKITFAYIPEVQEWALVRHSINGRVVLTKYELKAIIKEIEKLGSKK